MKKLLPYLLLGLISHSTVMAQPADRFCGYLQTLLDAQRVEDAALSRMAAGAKDGSFVNPVDADQARASSVFRVARDALLTLSKQTPIADIFACASAKAAERKQAVEERREVAQQSSDIWSLGAPKRIAQNMYFGCALNAISEVRCWWWDTLLPFEAPAELEIGAVKSLVASDLVICAIKANDEVACWGNEEPQEVPPQLGKVRQLVADATHFCGLKADLSVLCWGIGHSTETPKGLRDVESLAADRNGGICAVSLGDSVQCWDPLSGRPRGEDEFKEEMDRVVAERGARQFSFAYWYPKKVTFQTRFLTGFCAIGKAGDASCTKEWASAEKHFSDVKLRELVVDGTCAYGIDASGKVLGVLVSDKIGAPACQPPAELGPVYSIDYSVRERRTRNIHRACVVDFEHRPWCWGADGKFLAIP